MTGLSPDHKYTEVEDSSVERLIVLDGEIMEQGNGFWVKFSAQIVPKTGGKPHGINYSLCLYHAEKGRVLCYDNAHPIEVGNGPSKTRTTEYDHIHRGARMRPYAYSTADALIQDFWTDVDEILKKGGVP